MANVVTLTITVGQAASAELDTDTATRIAREASEHVLRALASKGYSSATVTATSA